MMEPGVYTNNKTGNEYRILGFGKYTNNYCLKDYNQKIITGVDCTNKRDGDIVKIYYDVGVFPAIKYFIYTEDKSINEIECVVYIKIDEFTITRAFVRETKEFKEKFTIKGE